MAVPFLILPFFPNVGGRGLGLEDVPGLRAERYSPEALVSGHSAVTLCPGNTPVARRHIPLTNLRFFGQMVRNEGSDPPN